jgi:hypothetical protein
LAHRLENIVWGGQRFASSDQRRCLFRVGGLDVRGLRLVRRRLAVLLGLLDALLDVGHGNRLASGGALDDLGAGRLGRRGCGEQVERAQGQIGM